MSGESGGSSRAARPVRICVYAFSGTALFFRALMEACAAAGDAVEWYAVHPQGHFRHVLAGLVPQERRCYLYDHFQTYYAKNDPANVERAMSSGQGLTVALLKDKDGYRWLDKDEQLRRGGAIDAVYRAFLMRTRPDYVLFPDLEVVDGFILMNLCHELRIGVLYFTSLRFIGRSYFATDPVETLPTDFGDYNEDDVRAAGEIISKFQARISNNAADSYPVTIPPKPSWFRRLVVSSYLRWTSERRHESEETFTMRITRHILGFMAPLRQRRFDVLAARYFDVTDPGSLPSKFIFYALQYTPESSINGLEPYYIDQTRVIDALLLNLPHGHRLVVKEHPAMAGMRPISFYRELRRRPGLVLVHPKLDTRAVIERASVVTTVTGTVGLEAYILDRPVVLFGHACFAPLVQIAPSLGELRPFLEDLMSTYAPASDEDKAKALAKFVHIGGDFLISDPWYSPTVMAPQNIAATRAHLWRHLGRDGWTRGIR